MTGGGGGSGAGLGLRVSSYLSLHQQQGNNGAGAVFLPIQPLPNPIRKPPKYVIVLPFFFKIIGRSVGMLLLTVFSLLVFVSIWFATTKEEDASQGPEINWQLSHPFFGVEKAQSNNFRSSLVPKNDEHQKINVSPWNKREIKQPYTILINASMFPSKHPCENVVLPPPSMDRKHTGPRPCEVCYVSVEHAMALMPSSPSVSPLLKELHYFSEENSYMNESNGGSLFSGHPSLQQRKESFNIKDSMTVHCGFFKGSKPGSGSGFDINEIDLFEMEQCRGVVVASAIFGNYDIIQQPKNIGNATKKIACFFMFVDEETEAYIKNSTLTDSKLVGLWRLVVVKNLPYSDARRNGKVPKLLLHRLFPNARYSLWIDGKLELVKDPFQILERFLWRKKSTFAISRHYRRFDVFEEAEANKAAGKYDNASIDYQIEFYKKEGLTHYSETKLPITSDVPEGCVIIKEHIPITNLFTCLWFNDVDHFTSRDQISFSTIRDRIMSQVKWHPDMFWDCERRNFVVQAYHKDVLEYRRLSIFPPPPLLQPPPPRKRASSEITNRTQLIVKKLTRHSKVRGSGLRRHHRSRNNNARDKNSL